MGCHTKLPLYQLEKMCIYYSLRSFIELNVCQNKYYLVLAIGTIYKKYYKIYVIILTVVVNFID